MQTHTPTKKQWQIVLDKFYSVLPFALEHTCSLDMGQTEVNSYYPCGTVHCVGGWYAIAHFRDAAFDKTILVDFRHGADQMAIDFGFEDRSYLSMWALNNPELWGNEFGNLLFHAPVAYNGASNLIDVIRHLEKVADNCLNAKR